MTAFERISKVAILFIVSNPSAISALAWLFTRNTFMLMQLSLGEREI